MASRRNAPPSPYCVAQRRERRGRPRNPRVPPHSRAWLPLLRTKANLAQISNTAATIPGIGKASVTTKMPVTLPMRDPRALLNEAEFQNALVHKVWIEDDALRAYQNLLDQLSTVQARLERDITNDAAAT